MTATESAIIAALRRSPGLTTWELVYETGLPLSKVAPEVEWLSQTEAIAWRGGDGWVVRNNGG